QVRGGPKFVPVATLELRAMRGDVPSIPAAREVDLTLLDADAPDADALRVELVTDTGSAVWSGKPVGNLSPGTPPRIRITRPLGPGLYLARIYRSSGRLIHEYGFRVTE
ncbi:MAG: hypothetical protein ABUS51_01855, partial [Acidobacteriota bacterium]